MIKNNQSKFNFIHIVLDAVVMAMSYILAFHVVIGSHVRTDGVQVALPAEVYFRALIVIVPAYIILYGIFNLYTPKRIQSRRRELANICKANIIGLMHNLHTVCRKEPAGDRTLLKELLHKDDRGLFRHKHHPGDSVQECLKGMPVEFKGQGI